MSTTATAFTITAARDKLLQAVSICSGVAARNAVKPVLRNLRIDAEDDGATIHATDLEVSISVPLECDSETGSVLLPADRLNAILNSLPDLPVQILADEDSATIQCGTTRLRIPTMPVEDFPATATPTKFQAELKCGKLSDALKRTVFAIDEGSTRYALGGVRFELDNDLHVIGCDGRRLAHATIHDVIGKNEHVAIVPKKAVTAIAKLIKDSVDCSIGWDSNTFWLSCHSGCIVSRLVEGRYPRWSDVIPDDLPHSIPMLAGPLLELVRRASLATSEDSRGMEFNFGKGSVLLATSSSDNGEAESSMPVKFDEKASVTLDPRYVSDFLKCLAPDAEVTLSLGTAEQATLWRVEGYEYVIMPLARDS